MLLIGYLDGYTGYGHMTQEIGYALHDLGVPVQFRSLFHDEEHLPLPGFVQSRLVDCLPESEPAIWIVNPMEKIPKGSVVFTMWETDGLPAKCVANLNRARLVLVPCTFNAEGFRRAGVTSPIRVVPLGIDPALYAALDSPPGGWDETPFIFGTSGRFSLKSDRKGLLDVAQGFLRAFPYGNEPVELRYKSFSEDASLLREVLPDDPRISVDTRTLSNHGVAGWHRSLHCYVSASRCEGWGLQVHEAMASGRPTIVVPWGGVCDFWDGRCGWGIDYVLGPAPGIHAGSGQWAYPLISDIAVCMTAAVRDRYACLDLGQAAFGIAHEFTWQRTAKECIMSLEGVM